MRIPQPVSWRLAAGIATAAFGFVALLGWVLELPRLASFGADWKPMAPSTAVLFLWFGAAICWRARMPLSRRAFWINAAAGCLGALVALLLFELGCREIHWAVEHLGVNISGGVGGAATGHMSPVSAFCFLLASVSFLASLSRSAARAWRSALALAAAGVLLGACFVFLLAYLYGTPLLYGGTFVLPALNSILAFVALGVGLALLALAGMPAKLFRRSPGADSGPAFVFVLIFVLLGAGIVTLAYINYRIYEKHYRAQVERELSAIAELKVGELVQWREDRRSDAAIFFKNPSFAALVRRFFAPAADADAQRQIQDWLGKYPGADDYTQVFLLDAQGVRRLSVPADPNPVCPETGRVAAETLRTGQVAIQDFDRHDNEQRIYLAVMIPIFDELDANRPLAVLGLRIEPTTYLYPFLKRWPAPSPTAETLLVRRDGNDVLYLTDLRHQANAAFVLRVSLERTDIPAVRAALGQTGIVQGVDYRGVPVIAATQAVPDSPWFLVAKKDTAEAYAPLKQAEWIVGMFVGVLLLSAGAGVMLASRQQRIRFYQERAKVAEAVLESEASLRVAQRLAHVGSWRWNVATNVVQWSEERCRINGHDPKHPEPSFAEISSFYTPESRQRLNETVARALRTGEAYELELDLIRTDGTVRHTLARGEVDYDASGKIVSLHGTVQDITERKRAEESMARLSQRHELILGSVTEGILGLDLQGNHTFVNPAAASMLGYAAAELLGRPSHDAWHHTKPDGRPHPIEECRIHAAYRDGATHRVSTEVFWRKNGTSFPVEYVSSPIYEQGRLAGAVVTFANITERIQAEERIRTLLAESNRARLALVGILEDETRAKETLKNSEGMLQRILDLLPVGLWLADKDGMLLRGNPAGVKIWGAEPLVGPSEYGIFKARRLPSGEPVAADDWALAHAIRDRVTIVDELLEIDAFDGKKKTILSYAAPVLDAQGDIQGAIVVNQDITERQRAEKRIRMFSREVLAAREEERKRVSADLHHDVGSLAVGMAAYFAMIEKAIRSGQAGQALEFAAAAGKLLSQSVARLKGVAIKLRPPELDILGLGDALREHFSRVTAATGLDITFTDMLGKTRLTEHAATVMFRIVQEALTNAVRHGQAKKADVSLMASKDAVRLTLRDNGTGFDAAEKRTRATPMLGLRVMREMATSAGGSFEIESAPGTGTTVQVRLPLETAAAEPGDVTEREKTAARKRTPRPSGHGARPQKGSST